jgi:hypothetical protein
MNHKVSVLDSGDFVVKYLIPPQDPVVQTPQTKDPSTNLDFVTNSAANQTPSLPDWPFE